MNDGFGVRRLAAAFAAPKAAASRRTPIALLLLAAVTLSACGRHKLRPDELQRNEFFAEILDRQDRRFLGDDDFFPKNLLHNRYFEVRPWCAAALGRIGSRRALPWLYESLRAGDAAVRAASAFAIGEIEDRDLLQDQYLQVNPQSLTELMRALDDPSLSVQMRATEALGKIGAHPEAAAIVGRLTDVHSFKTPQQLAYLDLAITALIRLKDPVSFSVLEQLAAEKTTDIQWRAANALIRMRDPAACPLYLRMLESPNADVRAYGARGIGTCGDPGLSKKLFPLLYPRGAGSTEPIPLPVRHCALQSLGELKSSDSVPAIDAALRADPIDDRHPDQVNFAIYSAATLGKIGAPDGEATLARLVRIHGPVADGAVIALAKVFKEDPDKFFQLVNRSQFTTGASARAWAGALGELGGPQAIGELKLLLARSAVQDEIQSDSKGIPAILTALGKAAAPDLNEFLVPFLHFHDGVILRAAAAAYQPIQGMRTPWVPVIEAYNGIADSNDAETKVALLKRLEPWLGEHDVQSALRGALRDGERNARLISAGLLRRSGSLDVPEDPGPPANAASALTYMMITAARRDRTMAVLETTRGDIEIELYREDAPMTVSNFVSLAKRGFYDGTSFMRVVPFFVIQGGDPRDDQEGGPGYSIRCEINMRPFERGSIGMALAGKDTGGSQFFITLAPQPHLDGGYTCFGRVISGMQAVEHMVPGDRIKRIVIKDDVTMLDYRRF